MKLKKARVAAATATLQKNLVAKNNSIPDIPEKSSLKRNSMIERKLRETPKPYKRTYLKAVNGESLRSSINSFCLDCMAWKKKEVRLCPSLACPLWAVRPYQNVRKSVPEACDNDLKTTNEERGNQDA